MNRSKSNAVGAFVVLALVFTSAVLWQLGRPKPEPAVHPHQVGAGNEGAAAQETGAVEAVGDWVIAPDSVFTPESDAITLADWITAYQRATQIERRKLLQYGIELAQTRRVEMARMIREDPQQAMQQALTPRQYGALPPEVRELVERPIVAVGMYTVAAICHHGPDEPHGSGCRLEYGAILGFGTFEAEFFKAGSVYGTRKHRQTEEEASLYGVVMDGYIALHEDDVVLVDDGEGQAGGRFAVYYQGHEHLFDDYAAAVELRQYLIDQHGKEP